MIRSAIPTPNYQGGLFMSRKYTFSVTQRIDVYANSYESAVDLLPSYPGGFDGLPTWNITDETITLSEEAEDDRE